MALGFSVPFLDYFFLIPIQHVLLMLPAINGLGIRESANIILLGHYGISASEAAAFSMLDLGMLLIVAVVGWLRFLMRRSMVVTVKAARSL